MAQEGGVIAWVFSGTCGPVVHEEFVQGLAFVDRVGDQEPAGVFVKAEVVVDVVDVGEGLVGGNGFGAFWVRFPEEGVAGEDGLVGVILDDANKASGHVVIDVGVVGGGIVGVGAWVEGSGGWSDEGLEVMKGG